MQACKTWMQRKKHVWHFQHIRITKQCDSCTRIFCEVNTQACPRDATVDLKFVPSSYHIAGNLFEAEYHYYMLSAQCSASQRISACGPRLHGLEMLWLTATTWR